MIQPNKKMATFMAQAPVIPVLTVDNPEVAVPMALSLVRGGLRVLEVTLRTDAALEVIRRIVEAVPDAIVGAGTVNTPDQVRAAIAVGAQFGVSPGATQILLDTVQEAGWPFLAGTATPSEVLRLLERGLTCMKFFPAQAAGGVSMLKSIAGPLPQALFCPTGGINLENAASYLALPNVLCVGGSWLCPQEALAKGNWSLIENLAREAASLAS